MIGERIFYPLLTRRERYSDQSEYAGYRQEIREDCKGRCVYCDVHENEMGGTSEMTLDHLRPRAHYSNLLNDPYNLVLACKGCNTLKGSHWPAKNGPQTIEGTEGFIEPFGEDRLNYFEIAESGELQPRQHPAEYIINVLVLNRQFLTAMRKKRLLKTQSMQETKRYIDVAITDIDDLLQLTGLTSEERIMLISERSDFELQIQDIFITFFDFTLY